MEPKQAPPLLKYNTNAFCILGLSATASTPAILERVNECKIYAKLGTSPRFPDAIPYFLNCARTEDMIRSSHHLLENTKKRLLEELFWFWDEGADNLRAFKCLAESRSEEACSIWEQASKNGSSVNEKIVAKHNQVVWRHASLLKEESTGKELTLPHWNGWRRCLKDWMELLAQEDLWIYVSQRSEQIDGVQRSDLIDSLRRELFMEVLTINAELIRFYVKSGDLDTVTQHARLISDANIPHIYYKRLLDALLRTVEDEIASTVTQWKKEFNQRERSLDDPQDVEDCCKQVYQQMRDRIGEGLSLLGILDKDNLSDAALAAEEYASFIRSLAIKLSNNAGNHSLAKKLIKEVRGYAINTSFKNQLDKDLAALDRLTLAEDIKTGSVNDLLGQMSESAKSETQQTSTKPKPEESKKTRPLDPKKHYRVTVSGQQVMIPPECNCCLGKADSKDYTSYECESGNVKHTISLALPVCKGCANHRLGLIYKIISLIIITVASGFGWAYWLTKIWPFVPVPLLGISTTVVTLATYFLANLILPFKGVGDDHGSSEDSVKMAGAYGGTVTFEFSNAVYATLFGVENGAQARPFSKWGHSRKRVFPLSSKSGFVSLLSASVILSLGLWFYWAGMSHATLYVDNGYEYPIMLDFERGSLVYEIPSGISTINVPVASIRTVVTQSHKNAESRPQNVPEGFELESLGEYSLDISSPGNWLFNPGRLNSYALMEVQYGSTSRQPRGHSLGNPTLFKISADYIFTKPPKSISTKSGDEIRSVLIHAENAENFDVPDNLQQLKSSIDERQRELEEEQELLSEMENRIDNYQKRIDEIAISGYVPNHMTYEYNWLINKANQEIEVYNDRLRRWKELRDEHNKQVEQYNARINS